MADRSNYKLDKYSAPALDKGLDILELLSDATSGLTQTEIAQMLGRSVSEIFRMLVVLRRREMIALDEHSDRYFLTTKIFELSQKVPIVKRLTIAANPIMNQLAVACGQSVHISIISGTSVVIVGKAESPGNNVLSVRLGARIDFWNTSSGSVIMAFQNKLAISNFLDQCPHPDGLTREEVHKEFDRIHRNGFQKMPSYVVKGVTNISVPIIGHDGSAVAALTTPYIELHSHMASASVQECCKKLIEASLTLSSQLGASTPKRS